MRIFRILVLALGASAVGAVSAYAQKELPTSGAITITLDDATRDQYIYGLPIFRKYGVEGTLFLTTGDMGEEAGTGRWASLTWSEAREFLDAGFEAGGHTITHRHLPQLTTIELQAELGFPQALIYHKIGVFPTTFAAPFGDIQDSNGRVANAIREIYDAHAWWGGGEGTGYNSLVSVDPYQIGRVEIKRDTKPQDVCDKIAVAAKEVLWIVLVFHGIVPKPLTGPEGEYQTSTAAVEEIAKCSAAFVKNGSLRTGSIKEILDTIPHRHGPGRNVDKPIMSLIKGSARTQPY